MSSGFRGLLHGHYIVHGVMFMSISDAGRCKH